MELNVLTVLITCLTSVAVSRAQEILKTCSQGNLLDCPKFSLCAKVNATDNDALKCICLQNFLLNPSWQNYDDPTDASVLQEHYCLPTNGTAQQEEGNKLTVYIRSPARSEHLVFGILLVLLAATLATAVLYGLKVLRPIKRTKALYKKLKYKRQNITPLQEMDELELNRRYEMQTF